MKKLLFLLSILPITFTILAQDRIGIGTTNPQAQLHTTGDVMLAGVANNDTLSKIVVQNNAGLLAWRGAGTLTNYYWCLNGNNLNGPEFLGSINNTRLKLRTSNQDRITVFSGDEISTAIDVPAVEIFSPSANNGLDGPGLKIFRSGSTSGWAAAMDFAMNNNNGNKKTYARLNGGIESSTTNSEKGFLTFEIVSNGQIGNLQQQEKMRITSAGFVGIGTSAPVAQLHTTGTVLFSGILNNNSYNKLLVQDNTGQLYWRDASTITNNIGWALNGNNLTGSEFLGSTNNTRLKLRTSNQDRITVFSGDEISTAIDIPAVEIFSPSANNGLDGPGLRVYRSGSNSGWASAIDFSMNNSNGNKKTYARLNGGIESSFANNENGFITFEIISNGQLGNLVQQEKVRITSRGYVGIGTNNPTAQLHTTASVRFENIANGTGSYLVVDANGNIYKSNSGPANRSTADNSVDLKNMQSQIEQLQLEIKQLKNQIEKK